MTNYLTKLKTFQTVANGELFNKELTANDGVSLVNYVFGDDFGEFKDEVGESLQGLTATEAYSYLSNFAGNFYDIYGNLNGANIGSIFEQNLGIGDGSDTDENQGVIGTILSKSTEIFKLGENDDADFIAFDKAGKNGKAADLEKGDDGYNALLILSHAFYVLKNKGVDDTGITGNNDDDSTSSSSESSSSDDFWDNVKNAFNNAGILPQYHRIFFDAIKNKIRDSRGGGDVTKEDIDYVLQNNSSEDLFAFADESINAYLNESLNDNSELSGLFDEVGIPTQGKVEILRQFTDKGYNFADTINYIQENKSDFINKIRDYFQDKFHRLLSNLGANNSENDSGSDSDNTYSRID